MDAARDTVQIVLLDSTWTNRAHPLLRLLAGGPRAKAGEWFLEVQRVLYDIYRSFVILENFLNRADKNLYLGESREKIEVSDFEKTWLFSYTVDNAYLRIGACLDKVAQMVRVYYEHPEHGGPLLVHQRCGRCAPEIMDERGCTFAALVRSLRVAGRDKEIDAALFALEKSPRLSEVKNARNDIAHRIRKSGWYPGLDPGVRVSPRGEFQETTFTFGGEFPTPNDYRKIVAEAHNELAAQINVIGPKIFPDDRGAA